MKTAFLVLSVSLTVLSACSGGGSIRSACLSSSRSPGAEACSCADRVARQLLSSSDRGKAAKIIREPDRILPYTAARGGARRAFLERYRNWGATTAQVCAISNR